MSKWEVFYLTGAPATGKTSIANKIIECIDPVESISYKDLIMYYYKTKLSLEVTHKQLRQKSSEIVTPDIINEIDNVILPDMISQLRKKSHVIIDTHPVTKELYGFRATPFSYDILLKLGIDAIIVLYSDANTIKGRINSAEDGRLNCSLEDINTHISLQNSLALTYGILIGKPIYYLDTNTDIIQLTTWFYKKLHSKNNDTKWIGKENVG